MMMKDRKILDLDSGTLDPYLGMMMEKKWDS